MKKYHLSNYLNNKTAAIYQGESTAFSQWYVIYYNHGKMVGDSTFQNEREALMNGVSYIEKDVERSDKR